MEVVLVMFRADGERRSFPLTRDVTVIGRREDCDLRIPLTEVSRKHCRLVRSGENVRLEDLGSSNGTYHNGSRIQECIMQPGDQLQIGPVVFTVQIDGFPPEDAIEPPQAQDSGGSQVGMESDTSGSHLTTAGAHPPVSSFLSGRPEEPEGDDFLIAADEQDGEDEQDIIDFGDLPADQDKSR